MLADPAANTESTLIIGMNTAALITGSGSRKAAAVSMVFGGSTPEAQHQATVSVKSNFGNAALSGF